MERHIGRILGRLRATRNYATTSLYRGTLFGEAYEMYFNVPFSSDVADYEDVKRNGGFKSMETGTCTARLITAKATCGYLQS